MQTPLRNTRSQKGLRPAVSTETAGNLGIEAAFAHFLQEAQDAEAHWYAIKPPCHCKITRQSPLPNEEYLFSLLGLTIAGYNDFLVILGFAKDKKDKNEEGTIMIFQDAWKKYITRCNLGKVVELSQFGGREHFIRIGCQNRDHLDMPQAERPVPRFPFVRRRQALFQHRVKQAVKGVPPTVSPEKASADQAPASSTSLECPTATENVLEVLIESLQDYLLPLLLEHSVNAQAIETTLEKIQQRPLRSKACAISTRDKCCF
jgi:hypothetical protein